MTLSCSTANSYLWSTGETTQSILVSQSGQYTVAAQGLCSMFSSAPINIDVITPISPTVEPDTIMTGESTTLLVEGDHITWYDSPGGETVLATGNTFTTPLLTNNTTYWVSNSLMSHPPNDFVGMVDHQGTAYSDNATNAGLIFDCFSPFILAKTKVITATAGERKIDLLKANGDLIQTKTVNIPIGTTVIDLDFDVPVGTDYVLTTDATVNQANLGSISPQLRRSNQDVAYPYQIPGVVSIKNSNFNLDRYYYFYNWEVAFYGYTCESELVPVTVVVEEQSGSATLPAWAEGLRIFPNPGSGIVNVEIQGFSGAELLTAVKNSQGQTLQTRHFKAGAGNASFQTDLSQFPAGIYWIELASEGGVTQRKLMIR